MTTKSPLLETTLYGSGSYIADNLFPFCLFLVCREAESTIYTTNKDLPPAYSEGSTHKRKRRKMFDLQVERKMHAVFTIDCTK